MNAAFSPSAGIALLVDGERLSSIVARSSEPPIPREPADFRHLFADARDVQFVERMELDEIRRLLDEAAACDEALHLALIILDGDLSRGVRVEAAAELEALLVTPAIARHLRSVFAAAPFPPSMDVDGAARLCDFEGAFAELLDELIALQPAIAEAQTAWDIIPVSEFGSEIDRQHARAATVRAGLFYEFATTVPEKGSNPFVFEGLKNTSFKKVRNHLQILKRWVAPFPKTRVLTTRQTDEVEIGDEPESLGESKQPHRRINSREILANVTKQKTAIMRAIVQRDFDRALGFVDELVDYQLRNGGAIYASKSLCDLATHAKDRGLYELQLTLAARSVELSPDDGWSWAQHGHALLRTGDPQAALASYDRALLYSQNVVAKNGRAEVLKALGRLPEALDAYDEIGRLHPENVVAKNGRAEVLKALNRLPEALAAYDEIGRLHPEDVVAKNGRVGVLVAMGRLAEALAALAADKPAAQQDWISYHLRGMVFFKMGRIDQAVEIFEFGAANDPNPAHREYFRNALALTLLRQRNFPAARDLLVEIKSPSIQQSADVLRLHAFGELQQFDQAIEVDRRLPREGTAPLIQLTDELRRRYIERKTPRHDDEWLIDRECSLLLAI